jgi:hypothetical protein
MGQSEPSDSYSQEHKPLAGYAALAATFGGAVAISVAAARASGRQVPQRIPWWDVVLFGVATHKVARLISKDRVTSFMRAPFVRYEDDAGHGEVSEEPRGTGLRLATGELLACPYCLAQWVAAAFGVGYIVAPSETRLIASVYTAETISDFLQLVYKAVEEQAD